MHFTYCPVQIYNIIFRKFLEICQIISTKFGDPGDLNLMCTMLPDLLLGLPEFFAA